MKKQEKKLVNDITTPQPLKRDNEIDADELVHQHRDEEPDDTAFDEDEVVHKVKKNTNIEPGTMADIDDLVHENAEEDDEPI